MTAKELKEGTIWMPDDYEIIIISSNCVQEDAEIRIEGFEPNHEERVIYILAN